MHDSTSVCKYACMYVHIYDYVSVLLYFSVEMSMACMNLRVHVYTHTCVRSALAGQKLFSYRILNIQYVNLEQSSISMQLDLCVETCAA